MDEKPLDKDLKEAALAYHRHPTPDKISVVPTKGLTNQRDLALAYSPGVAARNAIVDDPHEVSQLTSRGNLVGAVTNGTAVLGLGNIGLLAAKPVMEGKGCNRAGQAEKSTRRACEHMHEATRMSWARLLKRVFDIDVECCACGGKLKIIAAIEELAVIVRILTHLGLPARAPPCSPARCRVRKAGERAQISPDTAPFTVPSAGDSVAGSSKGVLTSLFARVQF